jgi:hypothetical protein
VEGSSSNEADDEVQGRLQLEEKMVNLHLLPSDKPAQQCGQERVVADRLQLFLWLL